MQARRAEELSRIARLAAAEIQESLQRRLVAAYGPGWLIAINRHRKTEDGPIKSLSDHRFCLGVFGRDPATEGWVPEGMRLEARELVKLANKAYHDDPLTDNDIRRARSIQSRFRESSFVVSTGGSEAGSAYSDFDPLPGNDRYTAVFLKVREARNGVVKEVPLDPFNPAAGTVKVRFPPNLSHGTVLRLKLPGKGKESGALPGDLRVKVFIDGVLGGDMSGLDPEMLQEGAYIAAASLLTPQASRFLAGMREFLGTFKDHCVRMPELVLQHYAEASFEPLLSRQRLESYLSQASIGELTDAVHEMERHFRVGTQPP